MYSIVCIYCTATHCNNRHPSLDSELFVFVPDGQITSSSYMEDHTPSDARMSRGGWCASRESICEVESDDHYIQIDFGAELVVEAIAIDGVEGNGYVTEYYVEYGLDVEELYCVISQESNEAVSTLTVYDACDYCDICMHVPLCSYSFQIEECCCQRNMFHKIIHIHDVKLQLVLSLICSYIST